MAQIKWTPFSKKNKELVKKIVERATTEGLLADDATALNMDLVATHLNSVKLDFPKMLAADKFNFAHDICGIQRHLNRDNAQLMNSFLPRCSA